MNVLLAAEADRIQNYLFRSARLREVVGGSQLLAHFCEKVPESLGIVEEQVITSGGGSFYIKFDGKEEADMFGAELAEVYYRATGTTLSVAEPAPYDGEDYGAASKKAARALSRAKQSLGGPVAVSHFPQVALCDSCGIELAERHQERFPGDTSPGYLCTSCRRKAEEQWQGREDRRRGEKEPAGSFLKEFYSVLKPADWDQGDWEQRDWPGRHGPGRWQATAAEDVARFDSRGYVAYIVADGNGMGAIFSKCKKEEFVRRLSQELTPILRKSLAAPIRDLIQRWKRENRDLDLIPVLPLIMGGDDLFALVPAPWAIDIARCFCREFQRQINGKAKELADETGEQFTDTITMTASVIICKRSYPYYLAHEVGEERLRAAKRPVKALALQMGKHFSAVDFEFIVSSQLPRPEREPGKRSKREPGRRATLRPYWVIPDPPIGHSRETVPSGWGKEVEELLEWRLGLSQVPSRHLSRLRDLFDRIPDPHSPGFQDAKAAWESELQDLLARSSRDYENRNDAPIVKAIGELGGEGLDSWPLMQRTDRHPDDDWYGHALPDLLRVWDFAPKLDTSNVEYERGER